LRGACDEAISSYGNGKWEKGNGKRSFAHGKREMGCEKWEEILRLRETRSERREMRIEPALSGSWKREMRDEILR